MVASPSDPVVICRMRLLHEQRLFKYRTVLLLRLEQLSATMTSLSIIFHTDHHLIITIPVIILSITYLSINPQHRPCPRVRVRLSTARS